MDLQSFIRTLRMLSITRSSGAGIWTRNIVWNFSRTKKLRLQYLKTHHLHLGQSLCKIYQYFSSFKPFCFSFERQLWGWELNQKKEEERNSYLFIAQLIKLPNNKSPASCFATCCQVVLAIISSESWTTDLVGIKRNSDSVQF